jgi:hypothetical protein
MLISLVVHSKHKIARQAEDFVHQLLSFIIDGYFVRIKECMNKGEKTIYMVDLL